MKITSRDLVIDYGYCVEKIASFLRYYLNKNGLKGYVMGVSGGLDSSVCLKLAVQGVGSKRVYALLLPEVATPTEDMEDALTLVKSLKVRYDIINISDIVESVRRSIPIYDVDDRVADGNIKARVRMTILYYYANHLGYAVLGTSDKSELLLGYFTKYGDGGVDLLPIGDLYKTQVRQLARYLELPSRISEKKSSPGLWKGQLAEEELGFTYEEADPFLYAIFDLGLNPNEALKATGIDKRKAEAILKRIRMTYHKRIHPPIVRIGKKCVWDLKAI